MATFLFLVQLLFLGTVIPPAHTQAEDMCNLLLNATRRDFNVTVAPGTYQEITTYRVTIDDNTQNATKYLLQALSPQNVSVGEWKVAERENCSSIDTAVLNVTQKAANWVPPDSNISSVEIRAYIILNNNLTWLNTVTLNKEPTTTATPTTTPNSVSVVQSSCFFVAALQLPLLLVTSKLFS